MLRSACRTVPGSAAPSHAPSASWNALPSLVASCTACPLHRTRTQVVLFRGSRQPRVLFVGEAPGAEEDAAGVPFVGRSGRRLDAAVEGLGIPSSDWAVINILKCRPPENRFLPASAERCRPFLDRQIELLDPEWIVPLGRHALHALDPSAPPITEAAGTSRDLGRRKMFPMFHPAAVLHNPRLRPRWTADLERLRSAIAPAPETL
jgi:uracil-DNA glycosylase